MEKLLSAKQVADHLGMHPKTLYKALRENRIALNFVRKTGRTIAFRPRDVENYLSMREVIRTGEGVLHKRRKETVREKLSRKYKIVDIMTDEDAQKFFEGVAQRKTPEGYIELESEDEQGDE